MPLDQETKNVIIENVFKNADLFTDIISLDESCQLHRIQTKKKIIEDYNQNIFYLEHNDPDYQRTLLYTFLYGAESKLLGTGLRYNQLACVFKHPSFEEIIKKMIPEIEKKSPWNLNDESQFKSFCIQLLSFDLKFYKETIPIRLASYFYPDFIFPIFKTEELRKITEIFGFYPNENHRNCLLYYYNKCLLDKTKDLSINNVIKTYYLYQIKITVEILVQLNEKIPLDKIRMKYRQKWAQRMFNNGITILKDLNLI